jgi:hypothetical protein
LFVDRSCAVQLVIIITTALSLVVLPGLWCAIMPGLLLRLGLGSLVGPPLGLVAFRRADPILVRVLVGGTLLAFAILLEWRRGSGLVLLPPDQALLFAGARPRTVRATLLSFFALAYAASVATHALTISIHSQTWVSAGFLIPFAFVGGLAGRPLGDRLHAGAFAVLATLLLGGAGFCTLAAAVNLTLR